MAAIKDVAALPAGALVRAYAAAAGGIAPQPAQAVMVAMEESGLALSLTVEIRSKLLDAYQELIQMQA